MFDRAPLKILSEMHLYLDDERPTPEGFTHRAYTAPEAIKHLESGKVKHISLDHDLGPPEAGTGYDVAKWIEHRAHTDPSYTPPSMAIHSANPVGRAKMAQAIESIKRVIDNRS